MASGDKEFEPKVIFEEVGKVGLILSFIGSEVTLSSLVVFFAKLLGLPGPEELHPILDVLLTSLPITVAAAVMFFSYKNHELTAGKAFWTFTGAILVSTFLNLLFDFRAPNVPLNWNYGWFGIIPSYLYNFIKMFGPFPFVKSCVLGYFFGKWFFRLDSKLRGHKEKSSDQSDTTVH